MKKLMMGLGVVIIVLAVLLGGATIASNKSDVYVQANTANPGDEFSFGKGTQVVYYYSPTCSHCTDFKPEVQAFYNETKDLAGVDLYLMDTSKDQNRGAIAATEEDYTVDVAEINEKQAVEISGTPTAVLIENGEVSMIGVGASQISEIFDAAL